MTELAKTEVNARKVINGTIEDKLLTFEEFTKKDGQHPRHNNFFGYFCPEYTAIGKAYRQSKHSQKFQKENPQLDSNISSKIKEMLSKGELILSNIYKIEKELYEAYCIMHKYDVSNKELFR